MKSKIPEHIRDQLIIERKIQLWIEQEIVSRHPGWILRPGRSRKILARIYAQIFIVFAGYSITRSHSQSMHMGKGFRQGSPRAYISSINCKMKRWGKEIAQKSFPANIRIN